MTKKEIGIYLGSETTYPKMLELALKAESLGFDLALVDDHFVNDWPEAWTTMTAIGVQTSKIRIGHGVLTNSLRHPAYLAKSISGLDNIINGRYELYIGAGWNEKEYTAYDLMGNGQGMPSDNERVERLKETVQILNLMLTQEVSSFDGKYWKLIKAKNIPLPIQQPMKILIGCHNPRQPMMKIGANYGHGIDIFCGYDGNYSHGIKEIELFKSLLEKEGKSRDNYLISLSCPIILADTDEEAIKYAKNQKHQKYNEEINNYLIGSPETIIDKLNTIDADRFMITVNMEQRYGHPLDYFKYKVMNYLKD